MEPRWKSEFRKQSRSLFTVSDHTSLTEIVSALLETNLLRATKLQTGIEYVFFNDFDNNNDDFNALNVAFQFSNRSDYLGYRLTSLAGMRIERQDFKKRKSQTSTQTFITVYAGLE